MRLDEVRDDEEARTAKLLGVNAKLNFATAGAVAGLCVLSLAGL